MPAVSTFCIVCYSLSVGLKWDCYMYMHVDVRGGMQHSISFVYLNYELEPNESCEIVVHWSIQPYRDNIHQVKISDNRNWKRIRIMNNSTGPLRFDPSNDQCFVTNINNNIQNVYLISKFTVLQLCKYWAFLPQTDYCRSV